MSDIDHTKIEVVREVVLKVLQNQSKRPLQKQGSAFAPANVALCKYWGKRDSLLNLPVTSSLSISLGGYGTKTLLRPIVAERDSICLNGLELNENTHDVKSGVPKGFVSRLVAFLDLFRQAFHYPFSGQYLDSENTTQLQKPYFRIETESNIPVGAGLASSASGFAALVLALADLYQWKIEPSHLSILARLGSGSACRSLWHGFVEWKKGEEPLGFDSHGFVCPTSLNALWQDLRIGLLILNSGPKLFSSREAMTITQKSSEFYQTWSQRVAKDMETLKIALATQDFELLGETAESNALCMHALMLTAKPPILFSEASTLETWQRIWDLRKKGIKVYFTQDAGPNLKLLFLEQDVERILHEFSDLIVIDPFDRTPMVSNKFSFLNDSSSKA